MRFDHEASAEDLRALVRRYKEIVLRETGRPFPGDPREQLWGAIAAVFRSWNNERAVIYRRRYWIPEEWGTAVNVQAICRIRRPACAAASSPRFRPTSRISSNGTPAPPGATRFPPSGATNPKFGVHNRWR